ncbi:MAG TPA: hypothetical protein VGL76_10770 [Gaiellaceae bacterium]|jgi:hypothetical protein
MRGVLGTIGVVCVLAGIVWLGQGLNLIHGSFMSGEGRWALIGAVALAVGVVLLVAAWRPRRPSFGD